MEATLQLPSKGLVYDVPLENIIVRTLKGGDEKLLADLNVDNVEKKYLALLQNKIRGGAPVVSGIDPAKLTLGDRLFILIWQRVNSYSPMFKAELTCEHCFEHIHADIDLQNLSVRELPENFKEPFEISLDNGDKVHLRLFRIDDEIKVADKEKRDGVENSYLYRLALSLEEDKNIVEKVTYLEDLDGKDLAKIKHFHEHFSHGPELDKTPYTCPKCKEVGTLVLPFRPNFLIPRGSEVS